MILFGNINRSISGAGGGRAVCGAGGGGGLQIQQGFYSDPIR